MAERRLSQGDTVLSQLRHRNKTTSAPFQSLIQSHSKLLLENSDLTVRNQSLDAELKRATNEVNSLKQAAGAGGAGVGKCSKCSDMQEELLTAMREGAKDKQQILLLNEEVKNLKVANIAYGDDLRAAKEQIMHLKESLKVLRTQLEDKEKALMVSVEECASRTVELERQRAQLIQLKAENAELLQGYLAMKEAEAEKYNEIHRMMDEAEKKKRAAETKKPTSTPTSDHRTSTGLVDVLSGCESTLAFGCRLPTAVKFSTVAHDRAEVHSLAHNSSGSMLLTGSDDRTVKLWDSRSGTKLSTLEGAVKAVMCVSFSLDGNMALGASGDFAVRVWSLKTCRVLHTLTGHTGKIYTAAFMPDSHGVLSGGYDRMIKIWDLNKGLISKTLFCSSSCNDACVSKEGAVITSVHLDASIRIWDVRTGEFVHELSGIHSQPITSVCQHPMNEYQVVTNARDDTVCIVDTRKYDCLLTMKHQAYKNGVNWNRAAISPDGVYIAAGGVDGVIYLWDTNKGNFVTSLGAGHKSPIVSCSWGDNDQLASIEKEHRLVLWE